MCSHDSCNFWVVSPRFNALIVICFGKQKWRKCYVLELIIIVLFCSVSTLYHTDTHTQTGHKADLGWTRGGTMGRICWQRFQGHHRASRHTGRRSCYRPALQDTTALSVRGAYRHGWICTEIRTGSRPLLGNEPLWLILKHKRIVSIGKMVF